MYTKFAQVYDQLTQDIPYVKWADYLQSAFLKFNANPNLILELGCGTGSMAVELAKRGYDMIALDLSADMLSVAYEKAHRAKTNILFLNQDMREFELYGTVDAVICLLDSLNYMTSFNDIEKVFRLVNNYLNPGGMFIFDLNSPYKLSSILGNETFCEVGEDVSWIWKNTYDSKRKCATFDLTFFIRREDGLYERYDEIHKERAFSTEEIVKALDQADLTLLGEFAELGFKAPCQEEERIFYIAQKR
jgi:SAM-dependent methyltransferase